MKNTGLVVGIVVIVILAVLLLGGAGMMGFGGFGMIPAHACGASVGGYGGYGGMHGMMGGYGAQGFGFNPFGAILSYVIGALIIGSIVLLGVWLVRSGGRTLSGASSGDAALEILKARYARGEITQEQFNTIKHDLGV